MRVDGMGINSTQRLRQWNKDSCRSIRIMLIEVTSHVKDFSRRAIEILTSRDLHVFKSKIYYIATNFGYYYSSGDFSGRNRHWIRPIILPIYLHILKKWTWLRWALSEPLLSASVNYTYICIIVYSYMVCCSI